MGAREDILGFLSRPPENGRLFYTTQEIALGVGRGRTATHRALQRLHRWGMVERQVAWRARSGRVMRLIWAATPHGKKIVKGGADVRPTTHIKGLAPVLIFLGILLAAGCVINLDDLVGSAEIAQNSGSPKAYILDDLTDEVWGSTVAFLNPAGTITGYEVRINIHVSSLSGADSIQFSGCVNINGVYYTSINTGYTSGGDISFPNVNVAGSPTNTRVGLSVSGCTGDNCWETYDVRGSFQTNTVTIYTPPPTTTSTTQATTTSTPIPTTTQTTTTITTTVTTTTPGWASILVTATGGGSTPISNLQVNVFQDGGVIAYKSDTTDSQGGVSFSVEPGHSYLVKATLDDVMMSSGPTTLPSGASWQATLDWPMATPTSPPPTTWSGTGTPQPTTVVIDAGQFEGMTTDTMMLIGVFLMFVAIVVALRFRL